MTVAKPARRGGRTLAGVGLTMALAGCGGDVFAAGPAGVAHYDGSNWMPMSVPSGEFRGVWGSSGADVFAVGPSGAIIHFNGSTWTAMTGASVEILDGVWGSSGSDVFAVGRNATVVHYGR